MSFKRMNVQFITSKNVLESTADVVFKNSIPGEFTRPVAIKELVKLWAQHKPRRGEKFLVKANKRGYLITTAEFNKAKGLL